MSLALLRVASRALRSMSSEIGSSQQHAELPRCANASPEAFATAAGSAASAAAATDDALRTSLVDSYAEPHITASEVVAQVARLRDCSEGTVTTWDGGRTFGAEAALICALQHADVTVARHGAAAFLRIAQSAPNALLKLLDKTEPQILTVKLIWALHRHIGDLTVAQCICEGLSYLGAVSDDSLLPPHNLGASLQCLSGCGALDILVASMQLHPRDASGARHCLRTLRAVEATLEAGLSIRTSLPAALAALSVLKPPLHCLEVAAACDALSIVLAALQRCGPDAARSLMEAGAADTIVHTLLLPTGSELAQLALEITAGIVGASVYSAAADALLEKGIVEGLIHALPPDPRDVYCSHEAYVATRRQALPVFHAAACLARASQGASLKRLLSFRLLDGLASEVGAALEYGPGDVETHVGLAACAALCDVISCLLSLPAPPASSTAQIPTGARGGGGSFVLEAEPAGPSPDEMLVTGVLAARVPAVATRVIELASDSECEWDTPQLKQLRSCCDAMRQLAEHPQPCRQLHRSKAAGAAVALLIRMSYRDDRDCALAHDGDKTFASVCQLLHSLLAPARFRSSGDQGELRACVTELMKVVAACASNGFHQDDAAAMAACVFVEAVATSFQLRDTSAASRGARAVAARAVDSHIAPRALVVIIKDSSRNFPDGPARAASASALAKLVNASVQWRGAASAPLHVRVSNVGRAVLRALSSYPGRCIAKDATFAEAGLKCLSALASVTPYRRHLLKAGAVRALSLVLGWHLGSAGICRAACWLLGQLILDHELALQEGLALRPLWSDTIQPILSQHGTDDSVARNALSALVRAVLLEQPEASALAGAAAEPAAAGATAELANEIAESAKALMRSPECGSNVVSAGNLLLYVLQLAQLSDTNASLSLTGAVLQRALHAVAAGLPRIDRSQLMHAVALWAASHNDGTMLRHIAARGADAAVDWNKLVQVAAHAGHEQALDTAISIMREQMPPSPDRFRTSRWMCEALNPALCISIARGDVGLAHHLLQRWEFKAPPGGVEAFWLAAEARDVDMLDVLLQSPAMTVAGRVDAGVVALDKDGGQLELLEQLVAPSKSASAAAADSLAFGLLDSITELAEATLIAAVLNAPGRSAAVDIIQRMLLDARTDPVAAGQKALAAAAEQKRLLVLQALLEDPRVDPLPFARKRLTAAPPLERAARTTLMRQPALAYGLALRVPLAAAGAAAPLLRHAYDAADVAAMCAAAWRRRRAAVLAWGSERM